MEEEIKAFVKERWSNIGKFCFDMEWAFNVILDEIEDMSNQSNDDSIELWEDDKESESVAKQCAYTVAINSVRDFVYAMFGRFNVSCNNILCSDHGEIIEPSDEVFENMFIYYDGSCEEET